ncbi:hypothetical protein LTR10_011951 [Elasticomyces elasticus]|nr:hypothetical protein LTR10_011951 [Elasticomyces elasticus]KAK4968892.1 hypothetical protein LTR42_009171 [Elasticomyces elasticus]
MSYAAELAELARLAASKSPAVKAYLDTHRDQPTAPAFRTSAMQKIQRAFAEKQRHFLLVMPVPFNALWGDCAMFADMWSGANAAGDPADLATLSSTGIGIPKRGIKDFSFLCARVFQATRDTNGGLSVAPHERLAGAIALDRARTLYVFDIDGGAEQAIIPYSSLEMTATSAHTSKLMILPGYGKLEDYYLSAAKPYIVLRLDTFELEPVAATLEGLDHGTLSKALELTCGGHGANVDIQRGMAGNAYLGGKYGYGLAPFPSQSTLTRFRNYQGT